MLLICQEKESVEDETSQNGDVHRDKLAVFGKSNTIQNTARFNLQRMIRLVSKTIKIYRQVPMEQYHAFLNITSYQYNIFK